ncbi:cystathionine beta-lyase-like protein [Leptomonas pyrrhocoris]|uniref:cysteine-S-conjugate beta-lyase n=1 Tax=Leptomonas pyrrhocoris TaxID=157538 RepID=A0A0M9FW67_LEPPY|nr:cystathionine beta-lyase-like protein [Leptomonas pyrrhocoris]KPA77209.1 cystathionine beta-lyase-like protein [Leptomonas pyrrhocoris]|eukprot:XP_015655648.1 cystathionine beta-lyase-like protein [Leptomonas pyrrhocoris]
MPQTELTAATAAVSTCEDCDKCCCCRTHEAHVAKLETENHLLKQRLSEMEMMHAISAAKIHGSRTVLTALEEERQYLEQAMLPVSYKFPKGADYSELPTYPKRPHFDTAAKHPSTQVVIFDGCPNDPYHPSSMPIYQTATFVQPDIEEFGPYDYSRSGNPTRTAIETLVANLEGAHAAFAFSSGMAALQTLVTTLSAGDVILASSDLYGGMHRLLTQVTSRLGITVVFVPTWDIDAVRQGLEENPSAKLLHLESPTNPLMRIVNIRAVCELAHQHDVKVSIDNTMMSPVRCTPLALGCDYSIHSATKFLCGHSDVMCGIVCVKSEEDVKRIAFLQNAQGNALAPFDCWLLLRGIRTLSIRVAKQELNAVAVALFLSRQKHVVSRLHYSGINPATCPEVSSLTQENFYLHRSQTSGPGSVLSIETSSVKRSNAFVRACKLFKLTVSFGGCNSLVEMPCLLSHASIPKEKRTLPADLIRLSVGIEQIEDILADLTQAIAAAAQVSSGSDDSS